MQSLTPNRAPAKPAKKRRAEEEHVLTIGSSEFVTTGLPSRK